MFFFWKRGAFFSFRMCCFGIRPWSQKHWVNIKPRPPCILDRIWKYENWYLAEMFLSFLFLDLSNMFSFCVFFWVTHFQEFGGFFSKISINSLVEAMIGWKSHHPNVFASTARQRGSGSVGTRSEADGGRKHRLPRKLAVLHGDMNNYLETVCWFFFPRNNGALIQRAQNRQVFFFWWPTQRCD